MYQKVTIVGNLGADPELRYTPQGEPVTSFSVATNRKWQGGEETCWFRVTVWGNQAENCHAYLTKGRQVLVEGRLSPDKQTGGPRIWEMPDGSPRASYELRAIAVQFLGGGQHAAPASRPVAEVPDDEVPF